MRPTDSLALGLAASGGNITGVNVRASEFDAKRLELLHEAVLASKRIGVLDDPLHLPFMQPQLDETARQLKLKLVLVNARNPEEEVHGLDAVEGSRIDAVNVLASPMLYETRLLIIERLNQIRLPTIYEWLEMAVEGGLLGYGPL